MKSTLLAQREERNRLMVQPYLQRQTRFNQDYLKSPYIKLITGPRRAGKSVFALLMLRNENCAYLNFDDVALLSKWDESLVMTLLDEIYPGFEYLLLDEVQNLPQWDLWVSKLYRNGFNMVITGSNANMLSSEMATVLTGRYIPIEMLPFSLSEMFSFSQVTENAESGELIPKALMVADDYLRNGGFPETLNSRNLVKNYLGTLYDSIIWKDIVQRHKVRNTSDLNNVANYLISNFCNPFTANSLALELGISSVATTRKFCEYLHEPYLFYYLPRFNNKLKLMQKAAQKIYVVDNGFIQSSALNISENLGRLLENLVFIELIRRGYEAGKTLFYYRTRNDKETDFVTRTGNKVEQLIQVCYNLSSPKTYKREIDALIDCAEELHCDNLSVVTYSEHRIIEARGFKIKVLPFYQL